MVTGKTGHENYFMELSEAGQAVIKRNGWPILGMRLSWGDKVIGEKGLEGDWEKLCAGNMTPEKGLVSKF